MKILAVDLDGTLLRSDMLHESFWSAFSSNISTPFVSLFAMTKGKAFLKQYLANASNIDPGTLPYNEVVLNYIKEWKKRGGRVALVTASDQGLARKIAEHLDLFDEVHGSDGILNLKGEAKADFLKDRYGDGQFCYIGDSAADVSVWKHSNKAITVNASKSVQRRAELCSVDVENLQNNSISLMSYAKQLRPHQWIKNCLVALPLCAAQQFEGNAFIASLLVFICFNLIASSIYVLNDLLDLSADRLHIRKRNRPLASGDVPLLHGAILCIGLLTTGFYVAASISFSVVTVMLIYFAITTAYSLRLKREIIIDIFVLACLYTTRIIAGAVAAKIEISVWLIAFSIFFFLSLAAVKRQAELVDSISNQQEKINGRGYRADDLPIVSMIAMAAGFVSILVMALYIQTPEVANLYNQPEFLWGVCVILLYWVTNTIMIAQRGQMHDDPIVYAAKNRQSQLCFTLILLLVLLAEWL
ncbi:UbiA family prenyltransferase [Planktomarina temperata]|nr:UbiA family prenyltransferase [Planktomarina temperata]